MKGSPWPFSPYVMSASPCGEGYEYSIWKNGTKLSTHNSYKEAYEEAMRLKNASQG